MSVDLISITFKDKRYLTRSMFPDLQAECKIVLLKKQLLKHHSKHNIYIKTVKIS